MGLSRNANIIISCLFSAVAAFSVSLRCYSRWKRTYFGADDYVALPALAFVVGMGITSIIAALDGRLGSHVHLFEQDSSNLNHSETLLLQTRWALQLQSILALSFIRLSVVLFYRRIWIDSKRIFKSFILLLAAINTTWGLSFFLATVLQCQPVQLNWTVPYFHSPTCSRYHPILLATNISDMTLDALLLILTLPILPKLRLPPRQKLAVGGLLVLGTLVCAISLIRIIFSVRDIMHDTRDETMIWTFLESALALTIANLPTLLPLFQHRTPDLNPSSIPVTTLFLRSSQSKLPLHRHVSHDSDLSRLTKHRDDAVFETKVEGTNAMPTVRFNPILTGQERGIWPGLGGIMVQKHMSCHSEGVEP